jgi:hypothetical protein
MKLFGKLLLLSLSGVLLEFVLRYIDVYITKLDSHFSFSILLGGIFYAILFYIALSKYEKSAGMLKVLLPLYIGMLILSLPSHIFFFKESVILLCQDFCNIAITATAVLYYCHHKKAVLLAGGLCWLLLATCIRTLVLDYWGNNIYPIFS